jgi:hypothetical protein
MGLFRRWTAEEIKIIRRDYQTIGPTELGRRMGRAPGTIYHKASIMNLVKKWPKEKNDTVMKKRAENKDFVPSPEQIRDGCQKAREKRIPGSMID